jgi:hypothetical protein
MGDNGTRTVGSRPGRQFVRHYVEMLVAMIAGMLLFAPLWTVAGAALGWTAILDRPDVAALVMATDMTLGMSIWMRYRGHGWVPVAEMGVAMYASFVVLFVPFWTGLISGGTLMIAGHVLMLPAMLVAMLRRRAEYSHRHDRPGS